LISALPEAGNEVSMETDIEIQQEEKRAESQSGTEGTGTGTLESGGPKGPTCGAPEETPQQRVDEDEVKPNNFNAWPTCNTAIIHTKKDNILYIKNNWS
jgi:hypothetical protein